MKKLLLTMTALLAMTAGWAQEKTDVTSQYVQNASFEQDNIASLTPKSEAADGLRGYVVTAPQGWTVSNSIDVVSLIVTADCYTDNNFGKVTTLADGQQAYYLRVGWTNGSTSMSQTIASLPKGHYQMAAKVRSAYANQATSTFALKAGNKSAGNAFAQGATGCFTTMAWGDFSVDFEQTADGPATIGLDLSWVSGGSCLMVDDVRLFLLPDDYTGPEEPTFVSPTEGAVTADFVAEPQMKDDLLQMLANFATYLKNDFQEAQAPNSAGEACGCFRGENTMGNNEQGVRPNADLSMICAFLVKYGKDKVTLPAGVTWADLETMAMKSLVFAYSTHKANKLKVCAGNNYWGSTSTSDAVWESSLWAMSVAYSAFFQWDKLSDTQKNYIYKLLKAECNYELGRSIPTGYSGDTKAEENGWEADILAATLGLFPGDELAPRWFQRLREFAINSYSQKDDAQDQTVIDPDYDQTTVAQLYKGQNLYDDYTLQNHNLFHTSYQNVVMQELGEAALALKLFQQELYGTETWKTNALMHNNQKVMDEVLNWLALADGELAMPNGNDWSLFLYDQITSYSTMACFLRDPHSLMLENLAYKMIKARQTTTTDGSWLLRADVGARRMGVEAHRVMMTWLMHEVLSTADLQATPWESFNRQYSRAKVFSSQNIVRAATDSRFTTFSWSTGLQSYTGYIAANSVDKNKIIVPYRANNTGNFLGWYEVSGKATNATPVVSGIYQLKGNAYVMNGELQTNDGALNNRFAIYSTPGNAVIYIDYVRANQACTINREKGGLMAISVDELTNTQRTLYTAGGSETTDGATLTTLDGNWLNIDNALGVVVPVERQFAFGDRANNNSIMTARLYTLYAGSSRSVQAGETVSRRAVTYFSNVTADETAQLSTVNAQLATPEGWNGLIAFDPDQTGYLLLSNFASDQKCRLADVRTSLGAPVFSVPTTISDSGSTADFIAEENHSVANVLRFFIEGTGVEAVQDAEQDNVIYLLNQVKGDNTITVRTADAQQAITLKDKVLKVTYEGGSLRVEEADGFPRTDDEALTEGYTDVTSQYLTNASFEDDETYGKADGNVTLGSTTYNPCYVNTVSAANSKWQNILPVNGWTYGCSGYTNHEAMTGGSNYCRMYSMPYSATQYCVSPSNVGNYAARCSRPMWDDDCGDRVLTVLNSWDQGDNVIFQEISNLPAGRYRVLMDMRYECPNETGRDQDAEGQTITTSGGNVNRSRTGVVLNGYNTNPPIQLLRYPSQPNTWELMAFDFELTDDQPYATLSLGYQASQSQGAANQTLLYIDHIRLLSANDNLTGISSAPLTQPAATPVYDLQGRRIQGAPTKKGIYVKNHRKMVLR
ncbi:MAG: hypothetical protein IJ612_03360 [Prevotella sp.]|nr:hypothetical protein [Prevotella sp.]